MSNMIQLMLVVFGLALGSFVNALVWRLREKKDWVCGRSECVHCHHQLAAIDLVPVLSWLYLRGRCRYCRKRIDDNPLVELILPVAFSISYAFWAQPFEGLGVALFAVWLCILTLFLALAVYDIRWRLLPNKLVLCVTLLAVLYAVLLAVYERDISVLAMAIGGGLVISGLFYGIFQVSNGAWIGGGDVKLAVALGLLSGGVLQSFLLLFIASFLGLLSALPLMMRGEAHSKTQLPFGPFLIAGTIIAVLFGTRLLEWYGGLLYR